MVDHLETPRKEAAATVCSAKSLRLGHATVCFVTFYDGLDGFENRQKRTGEEETYMAEGTVHVSGRSNVGLKSQGHLVAKEN